MKYITTVVLREIEKGLFETFCDKCGKKIIRSAMALKILETKKINPVCYKCQHKKELSKQQNG